MPPDWGVADFSDIADYTLGRTPPRQSAEYWARNDGTPWVTIADMEPFGNIVKTAGRVSDEAIRRIFQSPPVPKGTLLMSFKLTIGRTSVLGVDAYHNEAIIAIRPRPAVDRDFLRYYLPTIDYGQHQDRAIKGHTLNRGKIDALPIPLPPPPEQRAIASMLSSINSASATQERVVATLKDLKAATMAKLLREGLRGEPLKQSAVGEIPKSWDVRALGTVARVSTGTTPATDRTEYYVGDTPFVKTAEIEDSVITSAEHHVSREAVENYGLRIYSPGSVFLAMYGQGKTRGRAALLQIHAATTQNTAALEPGPELRGSFLWHYLLGQYRALRQIGNLGHLSHLNLGYVKALLMPIPPLDQQDGIAAALSSLQQHLKAASDRAQCLRALFSSLLHRFMTGDLRVPPDLSARLGAQGGAGQDVSTSDGGSTLRGHGGKPDEAVLQEIVGRVVEAVAPEKIILFGSAARGEMGPDSDLDLLVVKACQNRREVARAVRACLRGVAPGRGKDVIVVTPEDVERDRETIGYIIRPALREGRVLYAA